MKITDFQKRIYNQHLIESRKAKNLPFRPRKNFSKIKDTDLIILEKLESFFIKFKEVSMSEFFSAPYKIYPHDDRFDLKFYITQKAIYVYNLLKKIEKNNSQQLNTNDSE